MAFGVVFDKPSKKSGVVDFLGKHHLSTALPFGFEVGHGEEFVYLTEHRLRLLGAEAVGEAVFVFLLLEVVDASHKGVATYGRGAEHSSFGSHGLTVAHKHGGVIHKRVGLFGRHLQLVWFELIVDIALCGDEHLAFGAEKLHQPAFVFDCKSHNTHIVVGFKGVETQYEVGLAHLDTGVFQHFGVGSETVGVQICQLVVGIDVNSFFGLTWSVDRTKDDIGKGMCVF